MFKNWEIVDKNPDFWLLLNYWKCCLSWGWLEVGEAIQMGSQSPVQPPPHVTSLGQILTWIQRVSLQCLDLDLSQKSGPPPGKTVGFWHKTFPPFNNHSLYARCCFEHARYSPKCYTHSSQLLSPYKTLWSKYDCYHTHFTGEDTEPQRC